MTPDGPALLNQPLPDLAAWTSHFLAAPIPVLEDTTESLRQLRQHEDAVDAHLLSETVIGDPLLTLKLLVHVSGRAASRGHAAPETVTAALVMSGIPPFFRHFGDGPTVEDRLRGHPEALEGLQRVMRRAHRAAAFALGFAVHRTDHDAPAIHSAALLHDFAEMLMWLHAPLLALKIVERQAASPELRSAAVQRSVLNIALADLQQSLMRAWSLPELLRQISSDVPSELPQVRNVVLAIRLARHTALGWDNPAVPDDLREIGDLLMLGPEPTRRLVRDIDGLDAADAGTAQTG